MKKTFLALGLSLLANAAMATPINFDITGSSLAANGNGLAVSNYQDYSGSFSLDDGQSHSFTFGTVTAQGFSSGNLALNIDFAAPITSTVTGTGDYSVFAFLFLKDGQLTWDGPVTADYDYLGNIGSFQITFDNIDTGLSLGYPSWNLTGTITNLGSTSASVPEPSSLALLAAGLIGIAAMRRKSAA